jgi:ribonuclease HI
VILDIKLPNRQCDDFVAWFLEKNGLFSIRSAYRLGMEPAYNSLSNGQSSSEPSGDRGIWDLVWKAHVPNKIRVFAWKVATSTLAVKSELHRRINTIEPVCTICGREDEDAHHALVRCTMARALREEMRKVWTLPSEETFQASGTEWLLSLLNGMHGDMRSRTLFLLWRVWHHRNNIVHGDGKASIAASATFIANYLTSFSTVTTANFDPKGKEIVSSELHMHEGSTGLTSWTAPEEGHFKANVDAGWDPRTRTAGIGVIIRDYLGRPILTEWKYVPSCASAEEAEVLACLEGLNHLTQHFLGPAILETDCLHAVQMINDPGKDRSDIWCLYLQAKELLRVFQGFSVTKVGRLSNAVAHSLAQLGKSGASGFMWRSSPSCASALIDHDCMNIV